MSDLPELPEPNRRVGLGLSYRSRLTLALLIAAVVPVVGFGLLLAVTGAMTDPAVGRLLLISIVLAALVGLLIAGVAAAGLMAPLRALAAAVDRASTGDLGTPIDIGGDDELARLAESHNRLAADLGRRDRQLERILAAGSSYSPRDGLESLTSRAVLDAREAFELIDCGVELVDPAEVEPAERIPGDPLPVRAELRVGPERFGLLTGRLPATARWERADQDLFELFAMVVAVAIRNAQLFARVEAQNAQLVELNAAKDEFLRGVSHNLQTPLARIRAYAEQIAAGREDARLEIISEQSDRLSRMVRQLLTVTRVDSGALKPRAEVVAVAPRVRRAWEALAADDVVFTLQDRAGGWLAIGDPDQLDQVLWALLDNAVKYGERRPVEATITVDGLAGRIRLTIADQGPGVADADRLRLFRRFERGSGRTGEDGSGLGLYVSRALLRAMGGDLVLEPAAAGRGAAFTAHLPAEQPEES